MKTLTRSAHAAKAIKNELKQAFPGINFSVKSSNFSMGDSVSISWADGPTESEVEMYTDKYQYGYFNGMEDIYENTNRRDDIPQSKYVSCNRKCIVTDFLKEKFDEITNSESWSNNFWRLQARTSIPEGAINFRIERTEQMSGLVEDLYKITFDIKEGQPKQTKINGSFVIVDYSEKAIAIFGNTKQIKDELKGIGGRFNPLLNNEGQKQAGWIFPKTKKIEVESLLNNNIHVHNEKTEVKQFSVNLSDSLSKKAEAVKEQAEKINTDVSGNWTYRRQRFADSAQRKRDNLFKIANILNCLSEQWQNNTISKDLKPIKSKSDIDLILTGCYPSPPDPGFSNWYAKEYPERKKKVDSLGIRNKEHFAEIKEKLNNIGKVELTEDERKAKEEKELLKKIHASNIPGFFPTPDVLIDKMIELSGIDENNPVKNILEPSAGIGSICDKVNNLCERLECCEQDYTLSSFLHVRGYNVVSNDIYDITGRKNYYDAIFMNPPFENKEDLKHIMYCYDLLNDTGVLVSIISSGAIKHGFNEWLEDKTHEIINIENGAFKNAFNSTGVGVKIIIINK